MSNKKVAVPTLNGMLSAHFGGSEYFTIYDVVDNKIVDTAILPVPEHTTGSYPNFLASQKITEIIVGGIGGKAITIFNNFGINVFLGANLKETKQLVEELLEGKLQLTGNSCNHEGDGPESHGDHNHHHHH